jgi:hypothetical protein
MLHNLSQGKPLHDGESLTTLAGYAAYIHMSQPELAAQLLEAIAEIT